MNNIIISALDEQFNKDCKVISTNSEYPSYTGIEKWIIITDLTEEELNSKYSEQVNPLRPFSLTHLIHSSFRMDFVILISFHPVFTVCHKHTSRKVKRGKAYQGMY